MPITSHSMRSRAIAAGDGLGRLECLVSELMDSARVGGRFGRVGVDRLELYDCLCWPHGASEYVQREFPEVVVDVRSCRQSITGFAVVFVWNGGSRFELAWYIAIALGLTGCAYVLYTSPWWGAYRWMQGI